MINFNRYDLLICYAEVEILFIDKEMMILQFLEHRTKLKKKSLLIQVCTDNRNRNKNN
jgi:hypothetical protein